jgi:hypothetical protein
MWSGDVLCRAGSLRETVITPRTFPKPFGFVLGRCWDSNSRVNIANMAVRDHCVFVKL